MRQRCQNPNHDAYYRYGGIGISVSIEWDTFDGFKRDMGERPSLDHSLDRISNTGNYEPGNCRWATRVEQGNNRKTSLFLTFEGKTQSVQIWARESGISHALLLYRLNAAWDIESALKTPPKNRK